MDDFDTDSTYDFERQGSFGVFRTDWSFPMEYFMVSFKPDEMKHLTLAKRLKSSTNLNFDMLLQRDIDEQRIEEQMEPYLRGLELKKQQDAAEGAIFFPPILAAVVPVDANEIVDYYATETIGKDKDGKERLVREWHSHFRTTHLLYPGVDAIALTRFDDPTKAPTTLSVKRDPVKFEARLAGDDGVGVRLVVIDGQHRLVTLMNIQANKPELLKNMSFPVCVVYAPLCTAAYAKLAAEKGESIPKIHEIFRKLFLDVNRNAERVSGHFEHLLNDIDTSAIASRQFCNFVLATHGKSGLAQIEWNVRNNKESKNIVRNYSLTSIGVVTPELEAHWARHYEFLLRLADVKDKLFDEEDGSRKVNFQKLTLRQKAVVEEQVKTHLVPILDTIFFSSEALAPLRVSFKESLDQLATEEQSTGKVATVAADVRAYLLDYADFHGEKNRAARLRLAAFEEKYLKTVDSSVDDWDRPLATRTIFQKALFEAFGDLIAQVKALKPSTGGLAAAFKMLMDTALGQKCAAFANDKLYLQYLVYTQRRMNQTSEARKTLAYLTLGWLKSPNVAQQVVAAMGLGEEDSKKAADTLSEVGLASLKRMLKMFATRRRAAFIAGFANDLSLAPDERSALQDALNQNRVDVEKAQRGEIDEAVISSAFEEMVAKRIHPEIIEARDQLKKALGLTVELVAESSEEDLLSLDE